MKKQKGMTLMEIVISIAVYGVLALLVTEIMTTVNATMRATSQLNDRLAFEAKFADNNMTKDSSGNPFDSKIVSYSITYDDGGTKHWIGDTTKQALEYKMDYRDPSIVGTNYAQNVNYRFITFDKIVMEPSEYPGESFSLFIRFVPYFSDEAPATLDGKKAAIESAKKIVKRIDSYKTELTNATNFNISPSDAPELKKKQSYSGNFALGSEWVLDIHNSSDTVTTDVKSLSAKLLFSISGDVLEDGTNRQWADNDLEIFLYNRLTSDVLSATYFNRAVVEFNVNTMEFNHPLSLTAAETMPEIIDYEAILAQ